MLHLFKSISVTLLFTLALSFSFGQDTIHIESGNPANGELTFKEGETVAIDQYHRITWFINSNSNVGSIEKVHKKKGSPVIFIGGPSRDGNNWTGKVMFAPEDLYRYYVTWTEKVSGKLHTYDPKIAVNPKFNLFKFLISLFVVLFASAFSIRYFTQKIKLAKGHRKNDQQNT